MVCRRSSTLVSINEVPYVGPSTEVGDRVRVQFPVRDIYLGM